MKPITRLVGEQVYVSYECGDYAAHCQAWKRLTTPIREVRRDQWWRILLHRIGVSS